MEKFVRQEGLVAPLDRSNVDTDAVIPKQYLKSIKRTGYGPNLFDEWRYLDHGEPGMDHSKRPLNPDFVLNQPRYRGATVLLARENFGCGSSREHAPWAILQYGFQAIIAPSFADIFYSNCAKNGMVLVVLPEDQVQAIAAAGEARIDLGAQTVEAGGATYSFEIDGEIKHRLLHGLDDISMTLERADEIAQFEAERERSGPDTLIFAG
jgi:3-isopropylmalate/(R)-2-methylmalate dehydratase small subunit